MSAKTTLEALNNLHLQYDGPIPAHLLAEAYAIDARSLLRKQRDVIERSGLPELERILRRATE
jgi:hypothetical protein|tara:strand:- start:143 stop:331 length:189 start_codon:yes stop_codon:yes gene_type:complete